MKRFAMILASTLLAAAPLSAQQSTPFAPPPPAPQATAVQNAPGLVLIYTFKQLGDTDRSAWLGAGMQDFMAAELSKTGWVTVKAMPETLTASDANKAIAEGRDAGAAAVLFGTYQISGMQVRVTGQLVQVATGNVLSVIQVTGSSQDVFKVEDQVGAQLQTAAAQDFGPKNAPAPTAAAMPAVTGSADSAAAAPSVIYPAPQVVIENPPQVYVSPSSPYYDDGYDYGYPGYYPYAYYPGVVGFGFVGGFRGVGHSFVGRVNGFGHFGGRIGGGFHGGGFHGGGFGGRR